VGGSTIGRQIRCALAMVACVSSCACGASPITSARLEAAIASTFANLVHVQVSWLGLPPVPPSELAVKASCRKPGVESNLGSYSGSGEWLCTLRWRGPERQSLRDNYDLFVTPDGCYTATAEGEGLAGPMLKALDGRDVRNLLYAFEGCFDTM
jgi:hypothetical protein